MTEPILFLVLVAAGAAAVAYYARVAARQRRRAEQLRERAETLSQQLRAAEQFVGRIAASVTSSTAEPAEPADAPALPPQLAGTPLAQALTGLSEETRNAVALLERRAEKRSEERAAAIQQTADAQVADARRESVDVARATVRAFASSLVQRAKNLSRSVSAGVRKVHISDEAYATLNEIDHLSQQMLLIASGFSVLAGDKLSARWRATTLTDIVRAAMGRVEGYERVQHPEMETLAVESRAVEAVIHTLAVLLSNALRYSPPAARVHVTLDHGHNAAFLIVDDAGLRMDDERVLWARKVLSGEQRDDITALGAYPQTGLRVAAALAKDYGFRVDITTPNIYGGTRAVIVLPQNLLTSPEAARSVPSRTAARTRAALPGQQTPAAPQRTRPEPATTTASGLTVRKRAPRNAASGSASASAVGSASASASASAEPGTQAAPAAKPAAPSVQPGTPGVAASWMAGTRRGRNHHHSSTPRTEEGR
ncbi:ATP-binding protein [Streptomyces sp. NPDC005435]|uniref:ATP-binding protein n=1 Tax=Streptomyces sp. NPDC005435 TaxID=3154464 RepID=UPI003453C2B3